MTGIVFLLLVGVVLALALEPAHRRATRSLRSHPDRPADGDDVRITAELRAAAQAERTGPRIVRALAAAGCSVPLQRSALTGRH